MEDFFYLCFGFAVCAAPFVGLGFLITLLRRPEDKEARERLDAVEQQLAWVRGEGTKLGQRIVALEQREKQLEADLAAARAAGALAAATPATATPATETPATETIASETVPVAHAAPQQATDDAAQQPEVAREARPETATEAQPIAEPSDAAAALAQTEATAAAPTEAAPALAGITEAAPAQPAPDQPAPAQPAPDQTAPAQTAPAQAAPAQAVPAGAGQLEAARGGAGVPPTPASPSAPLPSVPPPDAEGDGWERWIGVRGAAALGACVLVVAALYFFQFSIEHGWIGPFARVLIGLGAGLGLVLGSEPLRRRYEGTTIAQTLANWLAGAGIAILYASTWAASGLYHLVPTLVSGVGMVAITGACAGLAVYRDSLAIAVLGLFGGFLTPLALSTGEDRPISLFTYLFLLDAALLFLAQRKRWPSLAALALAFTALYQLTWIFGRMSEGTTLIGLVITVVFSVLFAGVTMLGGSDDEAEEVARTNRIVRVGAVLVPFALAIAFASQPGAMSSFGATLTLALVLSLGAILVGARDELGWLTPAAASATLGLLLVFLARHHRDDTIVWQAAVMAMAPALLFHGAAELGLRGVRLGRITLGGSGLPTGALLAGIGASVLIAGFALEHVEGYLTWAAVLVALSLSVLRVAHGTGWSIVTVLLSLFHGGAWALWSLVWADRHEPARLAAVSLLGVAHLALYQGLALLAHSRREVHEEDEQGELDGLLSRVGLVEAASALGPALLLLTLTVTEALRELQLPLHVALAFTLGLFVLMPAMRATSRAQPHLGILALLATGLVAFVLSVNELAPAPIRGLETARTIRFASSAIGVVLFTVLPTLSSRLSRTRWAWRAAAITPMLFFGALHHGWTWAFGTRFVGALPVLLGLLTLSLVLLARRRNDDDARVRTSALVWLSGATMLFVTVAIPLQLDREWITIGWALEAAALLALYRRLDHAGLKWVAMLLFASVGARLLLNPYVLGYYERSPLRVLNWLSYTYLVPAACLVAGGMLLRALEAERLRGWERAFLPAGVTRPFTALFYGLALVVGFAWLNLTIFDWYATGPALTIPTDRLPARDLTISISWAVYGLFVLALGMWRESTPMRLTSLLLILLTAAKVFLYDLSNLRDLYRVAALVGLAFSLIAVALAYQRFVFRSTRKAAASGPRPPSPPVAPQDPSSPSSKESA